MLTGCQEAGATYCLVVERGDHVVGALLALEDDLRDYQRVLLHHPAAGDDTAHRGHGALDIGRRRAGGEVLRHDHEWAGQTPDRDALVECACRLRHGLGPCGDRAVGTGLRVGRALLLLPGVRRLQLRSYQGLCYLGGAARLASVAGWSGRRCVRVGDACGEGAGAATTGSAVGRPGTPRLCLVEVVRPFPLNVARAMPRAAGRLETLPWAEVSGMETGDWGINRANEPSSRLRGWRGCR